MSAKKNVTLQQIYDRLVAVEGTVIGRFEKSDGQFTKIDGQFTKIDGQFREVALRFDQIEKGFKNDIAALHRRIDGIYDLLDKQTRDIETLTQEYHAITVGLRRVEAEVAELGKGLGAVKSELDLVKERLSGVEARVFALESQ